MTKHKAHAAIPEKFLLVHLSDADPATLELRVEVSDRDRVNAYGFAFDGVPVPMSQGRGKFFAPLGQTRSLEWVMVGDPGGSMHVKVTRAGVVVKERVKSTIPDGSAKGYDAFDITVN